MRILCIGLKGKAARSMYGFRYEKKHSLSGTIIFFRTGFFRINCQTSATRTGLSIVF